MSPASAGFFYALMIKTFFAYKDTMTARYNAQGKLMAATWLIVPNTTVVRPIGTSKTLLNLQKTSKIKKLKEIKTDTILEPNSTIKLDEVIKVGDMVSISNLTIGRGFAGGVKRWGFAGGPRTHGQSDRERSPGSSGGGTRMGRLYKGRHAPGKMGNQNVQVRNLLVLEVDVEKNKLLVKGLVPGSARTLAKLEVVK